MKNEAKFGATKDYCYLLDKAEKRELILQGVRCSLTLGVILLVLFISMPIILGA